MKLALKLVSVAVAGIALVLAIDTFVSIRREIALFQTDAEHDSRLLGRAVQAVLSEVLDSRGQDRVLELVRDMDKAERDLQIRWVWLDATGDDAHKPQVDLQKLQAVEKGKNVILIDADASGRRCLFNYVPMKVKEQHIGALELAEPLNQLESQHRALILRKVVVMAGLIVFSGLAVVILGTSWVGRPLTRLIEKVRRVGQGDLSEPLQLRARDELSELASSINTMCDQLAQSQERIRQENAARIQTLEQLRHADRLTTVGSLASGIAHELGTPLNVVLVKARQIAQQQLPEDEIRDSAQIIHSQTEKMTTIVRQLLDFARRRPREKTSVDLRETATRVVNLLMPLARKRDVSLSLDAGSDPLNVCADSGQIEQVVTNLILNAVQATSDGGEVDIRLHHKYREPQPEKGHMGANGEYVCLSVEDYGMGIPAENRERIFEPFFTTKDVGSGTGLGLSIAHGIVEEHGGWIECESQHGQGTRFSICLPRINNVSSSDLHDVCQGHSNQNSEV